MYGVFAPTYVYVRVFVWMCMRVIYFYFHFLCLPHRLTYDNVLSYILLCSLEYFTILVFFFQKKKSKNAYTKYFYCVQLLCEFYVYIRNAEKHWIQQKKNAAKKSRKKESRVVLIVFILYIAGFTS